MASQEVVVAIKALPVHKLSPGVEARTLNKEAKNVAKFAGWPTTHIFSEYVLVA